MLQHDEDGFIHCHLHCSNWKHYTLQWMALYTEMYAVSTWELYTLHIVVADGFIHCQVHCFNTGTFHVAACCKGWPHTLPGTPFQLGNITCCSMLGMASYTARYTVSTWEIYMLLGMASYSVRYTVSNQEYFMLQHVARNGFLHYQV